MVLNINSSVGNAPTVTESTTSPLVQPNGAPDQNAAKEFASLLSEPEHSAAASNASSSKPFGNPFAASPKQEQGNSSAGQATVSDHSSARAQQDSAQLTDVTTAQPLHSNQVPTSKTDQAGQAAPTAKPEQSAQPAPLAQVAQPGQSAPTAKPEQAGLAAPAAQSAQPDQSAPTAKPEQSAQAAPLAQAAQPGQSAPTAKPEQAGHTAPSAQAAQPGQSAPTAKPEQSAQAAPLAQAAQPGQSATTVKPEQSAQTAPLAQAAQPGQSAPTAKPEQSAQVAPLAQAAQPDQSASTAKPEQAGHTAPSAQAAQPGQSAPTTQAAPTSQTFQPSLASSNQTSSMADVAAKSAPQAMATQPKQDATLSTSASVPHSNGSVSTAQAFRGKDESFSVSDVSQGSALSEAQLAAASSLQAAVGIAPVTETFQSQGIEETISQPSVDGEKIQAMMNSVTKELGMRDLSQLKLGGEMTLKLDQGALPNTEVKVRFEGNEMVISVDSKSADVNAFCTDNLALLQQSVMNGMKEEMKVRVEIRNAPEQSDQQRQGGGSGGGQSGGKGSGGGDDSSGSRQQGRGQENEKLES